ncbi:hypothetical protein ACLOJK_029926, partial [Asimina triloba]
VGTEAVSSFNYPFSRKSIGNVTVRWNGKSGCGRARGDSSCSRMHHRRRTAAIAVSNFSRK